MTAADSRNYVPIYSEAREEQFIPTRTPPKVEIKAETLEERTAKLLQIVGSTPSGAEGKYSPIQIASAIRELISRGHKFYNPNGNVIDSFGDSSEENQDYSDPDSKTD